MLKKVLAFFVVTGLGTSSVFAGAVGAAPPTMKSGISSTITQDEDEEDEEEDEDEMEEGDEEDGEHASGKEEAEHDSDEVKMSDLSPEAQRAIKRAVGSNKITKIKSEKAFGVNVFEVVWTANDKEHEIVLTKKGTVLEHEETIDLNDAPKAVQKATKKLFPKSKGIVVERKVMIFYSIEALVGDEEEEILLTGTGVAIDVETDDEADEEDDDDGDDDDGDDDDGDHAKASDGKRDGSKAKASTEDDEEEDEDDDDDDEDDDDDGDGDNEGV